MRSKLRNVTLTLEESVARWARIEAARQDISVSRFLANILTERMKENDEHETAKQRDRARKPFLKSDRRPLSREEVHERTSRRRKSEAIYDAIHAISERSAKLLEGPPLDHGEMLYDENGLPK